MQRTIKSFVLRAGRISHRQQQALDEWTPAYSMPEPNALWDLNAEFKRSADTIVEIGFGMGGSLLAMANVQPDINFLGIEVHRAGIGSLVAELHDHAVTNVRVAPYDAVKVFKNSLPDNSISGVQIFFPDPWHKKRHHKRRLVQPDFVKLLLTKLKGGGFIHCATDWQNYAEHMLTIFSAEPELINEAGVNSYIPRPETRPLTKFEQRGQRLGHGVWDLMFRKR